MTWSFKARVCASVLATMVVACGGNSEQKLLADAQQALDRGDFKTASIQLKSALQSTPESARARFLFGKLLLETGDPKSAEIELRKAQDFKFPAETAAPLIARSMLARKMHAQVIAEFAKVQFTDANRQADLSAMVANAYLFSGQPDKASALVDSTLAAAPDNLPIRVVQARIFAGKGDADAALKALDQVVSKNAGEIDALRLQAELFLLVKQDRARALAAYRKLLEIRPSDLSANTQVIAIHLLNKDLAAARQQLEVLSKLAPKHPQTTMLDASIALQSGDAKRARDLLQPLLGLTKENPRVLLLMASAELKLNSLLQAETYLNKVLTSIPSSVDARRLLAALYLRRGEGKKTLDVLAPLIDNGPPDSGALAMAAEAHLLNGDTAKAETFFAKVVQLKPDDVQARTALALSRLSKGDPATATNELQSIAAEDKGTLADMALINTQLRLRQLDAALTAIDTLERKLPDKAMPADLRGRVYLLKQDGAKARASFESAVARDPVFFPSVAALAMFDVAEGKSDAARQRLEALLKVDPRNVRGLVSLAGLRSKQGADVDEVAQLLSRAISAEPSDPANRLLLADHWLQHNNPKLSLEAAQAGLAVIPEEPTLLDALGRAQIANDEMAQALKTFGKLAAQYPNSAFAQLRLAEAQMRAGNLSAAEQAVRRALEVAPNSLPAQRGLVVLAVRAKQPDKALVVARSLQRDRPKDMVGYLVEGDIHAAFKDWDSAVKAYRTGLQRPGANLLAVRLYTVLTTAKRNSEADRFAADWLRQEPKDTLLRYHLAKQAGAAGDFAQAEQRYSELLAIEPRDPVAMNDLAWILAKTGKPGAVAMAERALALSPENPNTLDTLAFALSEADQLPRAIESAKSAVRMAPDNPGFRLTLAKAYLKAGDKKNAKGELEELSKLGSKYLKHQEVKDLLKGL